MATMYRLFLLGFLTILSLCLFASCSATPPGETGQGAEGGKGNVIGFGKEVTLKEHLVSGKTVIFDFFSQYCPPCRRISPLLEKLGEKRSDIVVIKIDINRPGVTGIDWSSPVARQFALESIPHFKIYSPEGKLVAEGEDAYKQVQGLLEKEGIR